MNEIKIKSPHLTAMWYSLKFMLEHEVNGWPYSDIQTIELMEYLGHREKNTNKEYKLKLRDDQVQMIFEAIKTTLDNEIVENPEQLPTFFEAMEMTAIVLDKLDLYKTSPLKLIKGGKH